MQRICYIVFFLFAGLASWSCTGISQTNNTGDKSSQISETTPAAQDTSVSFDFNRNIRATDPRTPEEERQGFHLPPGFEIQLFAAEPDIGKPINMAFDAQGRLWVTQSHEYPFAAEEGEGSDHITILEDTNGDGRADKFIDFAGGLNIPMGIMPVPGGAIAYSIPYIYRFFDVDGDDRSDYRVALYGRFSHARDTHGMVNNFIRGFNGMINVCHGYNNLSIVTSADSGRVVLDGGSTFRISLDGTTIERVTTGLVNPFGSTYDHLGYFYTVDCHTNPIYQLIPGADYPQFGKSPSGIGFGPRMISHDHGPTAIAGALYYAANQFPPEYQGSFFSGNVVSSRVLRDKIVRRGSTPVAKHREPFILSEDPWFRPVDIVLGPDGALYIADFYNRIIGHYEVPLDHPGRDRRRGRIWRVVYTGDDHDVEATMPREDWSKAGIDQLIDDLDYLNLTVRMMAANQLVDRFGARAAEPVEDLLRNGSADSLQTLHGLWVLKRLDALPPDLLKAATNHPSRAVRTHAMRIISEYETLDSLKTALVLEGLRDNDPNVQRIAAHAMAQHPAQAFVEPLIRLRQHIPAYDTHLEYGVRLSLRNQLQQDAILQYVLKQQWSAEDSRVLADVMVGVKSAGAARFLMTHLENVSESPDNVAAYLQHAARFIPVSELDRVVTFARRKGRNQDLQLRLFQSVQQGLARRGAEAPDGMRRWGVELAGVVVRDSGRSAEEQLQAIDIAMDLDLEELKPALVALLENDKTPVELRVRAAHALAAITPEESIDLLRRILADESEGMAFRKEIVQALAGIGSGQSVAAAASLLPKVYYDLQVELARYLSATTTGARKLMDVVEQGSAPAQLLVERSVAERLDRRESEKLQQRREQLTANVDPIDQELRQIIQERIAGYDPAAADPQEGAQVFSAYCASCHRPQGDAVIAPSLIGIGSRGLESLVLHVLDPNRTVPDQFRYRTVTLKSGEVFNGLFQRKEGNLLVFIDPAGNERAVSEEEVVEQTVSEYSLMPANFADTIPEEEFDNLMAYLLTL